MDSFYIEKTVRVKVKEEDQFFMVGDYNVTFYGDPYLGNNGKEYYALEIIKFDGDTEIARNWLYVPRVNKRTYPDVWEKLHDESRLTALMKLARNSKVSI